MIRLRFSRFDEARQRPVLTWLAAAALFVAAVSATHARVPQQSAAPVSLLDQAVKAEAAFQFDLAAGELYQIVLERPQSPEAWPARARLARLLTLTGDLPTALLECQALRNELSSGHPLRQPMFDLATTLARRLRGRLSPSYFAALNMLQVQGVTQTDEPTHVDVDSAGRAVLVDSGQGRAYVITADVASPVPSAGGVSAAAFLRDGRLIVADKTGISVAGAKPVFFNGTWDGKTRQMKKTRALAATSVGDLLVVDRDYDGLLRCRIDATACAPWGPPGKVRAVVVGASDFVFVLDDRPQTVRVIDATGRLVASIGPSFDDRKFGEIVDIAVDGAYGLYVLDKATRLIDIFTLKVDRANAVSIVSSGGTTVPGDREPSMKTPSALGIMPDGAIVVAGRSMPRLLRFQ